MLFTTDKNEFLFTYSPSCFFPFGHGKTDTCMRVTWLGRPALSRPMSRNYRNDLWSSPWPLSPLTLGDKRYLPSHLRIRNNCAPKDWPLSLISFALGHYSGALKSEGARWEIFLGPINLSVRCQTSLWTNIHITLFG